jgi:multiple sugar transport system ATP-binding protein
MVFQNYALYPHMTVAENLSFGLRMRQVEAQTITQRVETVAKLLNIEHLLNRKPKQLSGGQQQRVALGRAIARQAQVFLLDEPLSNLDAQLREETRTQLKQLHTHYGITTIYVTHDQVEAMTLADQIVILNQGKIQQIGTPQNIYTQPANRMVATFLGSPPMNILPATYLDEVFRIESQSLPLSNQLKKQLNPKPGEAFDLGIRPEDLKIVSQGSGLKVEVRVIEPTGRETIVRGIVTCTDITINWTIPYPWRGNVGDTLLLQPNLAQIFVFDPCSGENLFTPNV